MPDNKRDRDEELETGLASVLEAYAELYPSMRERARIIARLDDPLVRAKMETLNRMMRTRNNVRESELIRQFNLTQSEAKVAVWLADGGSVAGFAEVRGLSTGTVRTHLKAVFAKTGVHRQSQLASLVLNRNRPVLN